MQPNEALHKRYPHLLDTQTDPETVALVEQLDTLYRTPEPPTHLTLAAVLAQREEEDGKPGLKLPLIQPWLFRPTFWLPRRTSIVVASLALAIILMAGSVYAFTNYFRSGIQPPPFDQGVSQVFKQHLLEEVDAAPQTIDGFTMNVQAAYADPNRVIVGYTMTKPGAHVYEEPLPSDALLTTPQGDRLRWEMASALSADAYTITFTSLTGILGNPPQISFHLSIHQIEVNEDKDGATHHLMLQGSMSFNFTVAFHAGRIANPHQSATANGKTFTLERVIVSLSSTRLFVQGIGVTGEFYPTLSVGDWQSSQIKAGILSEMGPVNANEIFISYNVSLFDQYGEWTLTLQKLSLDPPDAPKGVGTPWTFEFAVPGLA